jgi:hypothetical protein
LLPARISFPLNPDAPASVPCGTPTTVAAPDEVGLVAEFPLTELPRPGDDAAE